MVIGKVVLETQLSSKPIYSGTVINVAVDTVALPSGKEATRDVVRHPGGVCILPLLAPNPTAAPGSAEAEERVVLVEQFRYPLGQQLLEFPAGKLDVAGEAPLACAQRELWEETGYEAESWRLLTTLFTAPGFCDEKLYLYEARGLKRSQRAYVDAEEEHISLRTFTRPQLQALMQQQQLNDAKSLALMAYWLLG